ncbi:MAG: ATP-binding cassette domain-containing protein [Coriobacteriaceae bacterium]|nr:ATP-binding cassette domain-containing protein [Coriobacteriaceae bacterium]
MENSALQIYKAIGALQAVIANATTLEEAIQGGLKAIVENAGADSAVIWYADKAGDGTLHPYFWIGPVDLTRRAHKPGDGAVGRVYESQKAERLFEFNSLQDVETAIDFAGMPVSSMVCVPFTSQTENLGVVQFVNGESSAPFTDEVADVMEIMAMMAAIAIEENEALAEPWQPGEVVMELRDITREFQNGDVVTKVLKGVNLDVYEGEFLVLLGESGCGKSTLLNIIGGMDSATSGEFSYLGKDLSNATQQELTDFRRDNIGFIFQSYNLMPNLTALQNLKLIAELVDEPMDADEALDVVGLSERKKNYPSQMSGGQQQRVSIARALVKNPKIILADEPTAALDYTTSIEVLQVMEKIIEAGTTMVMVTHNEEITRMADRVVRMRDGRMHEVTVNRHRARAVDLVW